ncbi:CurL C-terminal domain-containing protein [Photorhabdus laumondii]
MIKRQVISDAAKSMGVLSPDSRCATFDEKANGYVRAEGVGCVVIKRLTDALQDGDSIYGVIESSAENHGGRANSLTAPNPQAQAALLQKAYTVQLADRVSYIETHGTGTKLGDPIEIDALQQAFKALVPAKQEGSIALGAVKSNIGHLEPAAGMASLLKVLLCLKHRFLPANINFSKQNPMIHLNGSPFQLLTQNRPWTSSGTRVAGISCFGFGGSNAHVVISEAPAARSLNRINRPSWLITLSAKTSYSLESMRRQLLAYLQESSDELADIAFTLACGRESFAYRMSWITDSVENLIAQVRASEKSVVEKCRLTQEVWASTLSEITSNVEWENLLQELQERFQQGSIIDWECLYQPSKYRRLHLPGYVFDTKTYWFEQASSSTVMKEVNHGS